LHVWKNADVTIVFITHDLDEAIYLADRILVLRPRPGSERPSVAEHLEVPVPRPRSPGQFTSPEFLAVKRRLEEWIHADSAAAAGVESLPRLRLTRVGDAVE